MGYVAQFTNSSDALFLKQLATSLAKAATAILSEDRATPFDTFRRAFAAKVLLNPTAYANSFSLSVAALIPVDTLPPTDAAVDVAVSGLWNNFAGVP